MDTDLLRLTSAYFAAAFHTKNSWVESVQRIIQLPCIDPVSFAVYKQWLETGNIILFNLPLDPNRYVFGFDAYKKNKDVVAGNKHNLSISSIELSLDILINCWILGDFLQAPAFQNDVLDDLEEQYFTLGHESHQIPLHNLAYIVENTTPDSPLRLFIIDGISKLLSKTTFTKASNLSLIPAEIAFAIAANSMASMDDSQNDSEDDPEDDSEHGSEDGSPADQTANTMDLDSEDDSPQHQAATTTDLEEEMNPYLKHSPDLEKLRFSSFESIIPHWSDSDDSESVDSEDAMSTTD